MLENFTSFFQSGAGFWIFFVIKICLGIFTIILFFDVMALIIKSRPSAMIKEAMKDTGFEKLIKKEKFQEKWKFVKDKLELKDENNLKLAVIEADLLLDEELENLKFIGETASERLENTASNTFSDLEKIKKAHQLRNNIVHESDFELSLEAAEDAIKVFEKAFKELELL